MWGGGVRPGSRIREGRYGDGHEDDGDVVLGLGLGDHSVLLRFTAPGSFSCSLRERKHHKIEIQQPGH